MTENIQQQAALGNRIESSKTDMLAVKMPQSGSFQELQQAESIKQAFHVEIQGMRDDLLRLVEAYEKLQEELKTAHIEHEKAKHLEEIEVRRMLEQQKRLEEAELNELGTMLYRQTGGS